MVHMNLDDLLSIRVRTNTHHAEEDILTDEEVDEILTSRTFAILGDVHAAMGSYMTLSNHRAHCASTGKKYHRNLPKRIKEHHARMIRLMSPKVAIVEEAYEQANAARRLRGKPELIFNWEDAASTVNPTEQINVKDAPPVPSNEWEALMGIYYKYWLKAMLVEMEAISSRDVYDVMKLPPGRKAINSKWVFDYKTDPLGFITRFKARLVAVGYHQREGIDYKETHSPVVKSKVVRLLVVLSAVLGIPIEQIDVDTAFLYGVLDEKNYMKLPRGFEKFDDDGTPMVAELKKSLYGLHQAGRQWYKSLYEFFRKHGFTQLKSDACTFLKCDKETGRIAVVVVYVDDIMIASSDSNFIQEIKDLIKQQYSIKDLGQVKWLLKVQIEKFDKGIYMGQPIYAEQLLRDYDMWELPESFWSETPMSTTWEHTNTSVPLKPEESSEFISLIARLLYLAMQTRPDILYAVNTLAQFQREPRMCDMEAGVKILKYLRKTYDLGLYYRSNANSSAIIFNSETPEKLKQRLKGFGITLMEGMAPEGWTDASLGQEIDRKSRSGYLVFAFGSLVAWFSKKQSTTALSSTEAELIAILEGIKEIKWLRDFLDELGFEFPEPTVMHQDNQSAIAIAVNPVHHARVKHMEIKTYFIREHIENGTVRFVYCPTNLMLADILTKALPGPQHWVLVRGMGMFRLKDLQFGNEITHTNVKVVWEK